MKENAMQENGAKPHESAENSVGEQNNECSGDEEVSEAADQPETLRVDDSDLPKDEAHDDEDPDLWKPHSPNEECPVCLAPLPLPIHGNCAMYYTCCGKQVCAACVREHNRSTAVFNSKRVKKELPPQPEQCPFCRVAQPESNKEILDRTLTRLSKGDPSAIFNYGMDNRHGRYGLPQDEIRAMELFHQSAELGCVDAMSALGGYYTFGMGLPKDVRRGLKYLKDAARRGDVLARKNLAIYEDRRGNTNLAIRHAKIAAAAGDPGSMKNVWRLFLRGKISKAEIEDVLRANKDACDEMKTDDRDRYNAFLDARDENDEVLKQYYQCYYDGKINAKELNAALKMHRATGSSIESFDMKAPF